MNTKEKLYLVLAEKLEAQFVNVKDESVKHSEHPGAKESEGGHYQIIVVSRQFEGKTQLERHRLIYGILQLDFGKQIHALAVKTFTPEEWRRTPQ